MTRSLEHPRASIEDEDPWLKRITMQVQMDGRDPQEAIDEVIQKGDHLAIGTAVSSMLHHPMSAMRAVTAVEKPHWTHRLPEGTPPILRASSLAGTAIHAAFGGDVNIMQQRVVTDRLLVPELDFYQGGTYGWEYNTETSEYDLLIHKRYEEDTKYIDPDTHIGDVDFVKRKGFTVRIPDEPGHFGSYDVHTRVGSIPITMGNARANMARHAIRYINYKPLNVPLS